MDLKRLDIIVPANGTLLCYLEEPQFPTYFLICHTRSAPAPAPGSHRRGCGSENGDSVRFRVKTKSNIVRNVNFEASMMYILKQTLMETSFLPCSVCQMC